MSSIMLPLLLECGRRKHVFDRPVQARSCHEACIMPHDQPPAAVMVERRPQRESRETGAGGDPKSAARRA